MNRRDKAMIRRWCQAQVAWSEDCKEGGYPTVVTRNNLHHAGRDLFAIAGTEPHPASVYADNSCIGRRSDGG